MTGFFHLLSSTTPNGTQFLKTQEVEVAADKLNSNVHQCHVAKPPSQHHSVLSKRKCCGRPNCEPANLQQAFLKTRQSLSFSQINRLIRTQETVLDHRNGKRELIAFCWPNPNATWTKLRKRRITPLTVSTTQTQSHSQQHLF